MRSVDQFVPTSRSEKAIADTRRFLEEFFERSAETLRGSQIGEYDFQNRIRFVLEDEDELARRQWREKREGGQDNDDIIRGGIITYCLSDARHILEQIKSSGCDIGEIEEADGLLRIMLPEGSFSGTGSRGQFYVKPGEIPEFAVPKENEGQPFTLRYDNQLLRVESLHSNEMWQNRRFTWDGKPKESVQT